MTIGLALLIALGLLVSCSLAVGLMVAGIAIGDRIGGLAGQLIAGGLFFMVFMTAGIYFVGSLP